MQVNSEDISHILIQQNLLTLEEINRITKKAADEKLPLLHYLVTNKILCSSKIAHACADYFGFETIDINRQESSELIYKAIPKKYLKYYAFIPITENPPTLAISDPIHFTFIRELEFQTNRHYKIVFAPYEQFIAFANQVVSQQIYRRASQSESNSIELADQLLTDAIYREASDIHLESLRWNYRVRMRLDGILHVIVELPTTALTAIISRLKILADLDISERRLPQDGRFEFTTLTGIRRDCRLSTCPTLFGEKLVIRLLNPMQNLLNLKQLGLTKKTGKQISKKITEPQGLILITGPTGSGKTVSLYAALNHINSSQKNISTVEDPIEIELEGVNQVNVHSKVKLDFACILKAFLRQDPDVIMIGEIRDFETAAIAIRAAHTGHLVFSTLHTNNASESITRLIDMGIEPFNIASTLKLVIAQRLVRRLCPHCKSKIPRCKFCLDGYKGRTGIFEILPITNTIRELILQKSSAKIIAAQAEKEGMQSLWHAGLKKVKANITTLKEIYRTIQLEPTHGTKKNKT